MMLSRRVLWAARALGAAAVCVMLLSAAHADHIAVRDAMEFVRVGNPDNDPDPEVWPHNNPDGLQFGAVPYVYDIGKYHVTVEQYEASGLGRGSGTNFQTLPNRPVNWVSWHNAARFTNWLTTGDPEYGVYDTSTWEAMDRGTALTTFGVAYFLPTEDEWYKAAYYNPDTESYYLYGTGSDTIAHEDANYDGDRNPPFRPTDVGTLEIETHLPSPYGAYDMAGNVWDWNETIIIGNHRGYRSGAFSRTGAHRLAASRRNEYGDPSGEWHDVGFRVASIPEPAGATMFLTGAVGLLFWRRRRNA